MDFTLKTSNSNKKNGNSKSVSVPKKTVDEIIDILSKVECTCVWSEPDNQYIKVRDIPEELVNELTMLSKLSI